MVPAATPAAPPETRRSGFLDDHHWGEIARALRLSAREFEIVRCIVDGCSEARIAERLGISIHTVHTHLERLYRKLAVSNRSELVVRLFATHVSLARPD
jgi:DNA-binding CsgD family transcriptional regulator